MLSPAQIMQRLEDIEADLAERQNEYAEVSEAWTRSKRDKEKAWADAYMGASGQVTDRKAAAIQASAEVGLEDEAKYVGLKGVVEVLNTRAMIGMGLLKAHGRTI